MDSREPSPVDEYIRLANTKLQRFLDRTAPFQLYRWSALAVLVLLYIVRVYSLRGAPDAPSMWIGAQAALPPLPHPMLGKL